MRGLQQAVVTGGHELPHRRIGQKIAGKLLDRELIERKIIVERLDDVIAVGCDAMVLIAVVADGRREPHEVEPPGGHALAVGGGS